MAREYRTAKETGQAGFENAGFDNAGFGDSRNQSRNRSSQDWKRKEDSPKKQGAFENTSFDSSACGGSAGRGNFQDRQQSRPALDRSGGNRPQQSKYGGGDRSRDTGNASGGMNRQSFGSSYQKSERDFDQKGDNRSRNRLYSISPERNQSSGKSGGSAGRFSNNRADNGPRFEQSSSSRNTPSFNDSGYRASYDRNSSKFSSSGQKRSVGSISRYRDGHDNRTCSPERKQTRHEGAEPSDNPWVHDKFKPSQGPGKKPNKQECEDIDESIQFELEENY